jgi:tetratricopeptide (TPR) repeat protein
MIPILRRTCLLLSIAFVVAAPLGATGARPISEAERAAVDDAAAYLSGGPDALMPRLSSTSPLRKLAPADAAKEIEVRLGPTASVKWELQTVVPALAEKAAVFDIQYPSGVDEAATFEMTNDGGTYKIENIRILAEESRQKPIFPRVVDEPEKKSEARFPGDTVALALGLIAVLIAVAAPFIRKADKGWARLAVTSAALLATGGLAVALVLSDRARITPKAAPAATPVATADPFPRLAPLLDIRRSVASGADVTSIAAVATHGTLCRDVAQLWRAQIDLQQMRMDAVKKTLASFPTPSTIPLVEILRGRVALFEQDESASAIAYEHAVSLGPGRDGLWAETAHALLALGYEDRSLRYLERLDKIGTRDADSYYTLAMFRAARNKEEDAGKLLAAGWQLRPARRADVVGAQVLWSVIRSQEASKFMNLSEPEESTVTSPATSTRALSLPPAAVPRVSGDYLDIAIGDEQLGVPGGACLAPPGTTSIDAATWVRTENEKALHDYDRLLAVAGTAGAYTQPSLRQRITQSADALAERNRWPELIRLTDGLSPKSEHIPPLLFFLRATALQRMQRTLDAKQLLEAVATGRALQRRRDARALVELGELLASHDLYDEAVRMLDKAQSIKQNERVEDTVAQIQMNKRLATKYSVFKSANFEIHYPDELSPVSAQLISEILESEYKRLQAWVPTPNFRPVVVNIVWWHDFHSVITGNDFTLGITYMGKITVPLAGIPIYPPEIVAILSHELLHAMLAQATNDQAPRWFQEGMAQRIEMVGVMRNAFNMYDDSKLLAFALLDRVMRESPDPEMIGEGYLLSEAAIRYIESRYGKAGIVKMIDQYRSGATTEDAITALSGTTPAEFDRQFRQWGRAEQRVFETPILARYDSEEPQIHMRNGAAPSQPAAVARPQQAPGTLGGGTLYPTKRP